MTKELQENRAMPHSNKLLPLLFILFLSDASAATEIPWWMRGAYVVIECNTAKNILRLHHLPKTSANDPRCATPVCEAEWAQPDALDKAERKTSLADCENRMRQTCSAHLHLPPACKEAGKTSGTVCQVYDPADYLVVNTHSLVTQIKADSRDNCRLRDDTRYDVHLKPMLEHLNVRDDGWLGIEIQVKEWTHPEKGSTKIAYEGAFMFPWQQATPMVHRVTIIPDKESRVERVSPKAFRGATR
jgi:hypothetical protein